MTDGRPRVIGWGEMSLNALTQVRQAGKNENRKKRKLKWPEVGGERVDVGQCSAWLKERERQGLAV